MERQLFILREDHQHRTRHEFINSLTRSPANFNFSGVLRPLADKTALWKWVLKVQMVSLLHNHHIVHLTFTLKWQIEAKNCSVCSKEPPSHSPEYLTLIKTLIQTNPLSHPTVSLPLSPPPVTEAVTLHTNVLMDQVLWKAQIIQAAVLHISTTAFPRHTFPLKRKHTCNCLRVC